MKKSFNVLGVKVPVKIKKFDREHEGLAGFCSSNPLAIYINKDVVGDEVLKTCYHELAHGIMFRSGLAQVLSADAQEIFCEAFANVVFENFNVKK